MLKELEDYNWASAFQEANPPMLVINAKCSNTYFDREDVEHIIAMEDGVADEIDWIGIFKLKDGRFMFLSAGCDYTGWDCWASGQSWVADSLEDLWQFGLTDDARSRFKNLESILEVINVYLTRN